MSPHTRFEIFVPPDPSISAVACNPQTDATFKRLFERPQLEAFANEVRLYAGYCLLFTNESSQRITALTIVWEYPHPTLKGPSGNVSRSDAYYFGENSEGVVPPKSQALIYPKRTMPAAVLEYDNLLFASSEGRLNGLRDIDMMREAPRVTVTLDAVIFEDGRVLGDDESQTVEFITNRKKAAGDFVTIVRRAQEEGSNIDEVLQKLHARETSRRLLRFLASDVCPTPPSRTCNGPRPQLDGVRALASTSVGLGFRPEFRVGLPIFPRWWRRK